jgi:hypothetical protein
MRFREFSDLRQELVGQALGDIGSTLDPDTSENAGDLLGHVPGDDDRPFSVVNEAKLPPVLADCFERPVQFSGQSVLVDSLAK